MLLKIDWYYNVINAGWSFMVIVGLCQINAGDDMIIIMIQILT